MTTTRARRTVLGTCHHDCPDSCGWVATVEDGVAVSLRGNPDHPFSRGELCPKVNRFLDRVYHPDRVLYPLRRVGPKGEGAFERIWWDDALATVAARWREVVDRHGGEAILPWGSAGTQGLVQMSSLDRRLFARLGATRQTGSLCGATAGAGLAAAYGSGHGADPADVRHARLVLLWGTNTRLTNRHLWPFVQEARAAGARVVVIDPVRTVTADAADWFLQPRPGTDVALMLGMLHVIVRDDLVDHDYVNRYANGFEELAKEAGEWPPHRVAAVTGLTAAEVEELAVAYATTSPTMIRTLIGAEHHEAGAMFFRTLACLPVVTGAWRHLGGGLARSVGVYSEANVDDSVYDVPWTTRGLSMNHLGRWLTDPAVGIHALVVWNGNPLVSAPNAGLIRRGLERDDLFTVVSEQFLTDTARYADIVFPATTQLEHHDLVTAWGHLHLGWNEPAIEPLGEAVPNTELWRRLARAMGVHDPLFDLDDTELIALAVHGVDLDGLRARGWVRLAVAEPLMPYASGGFATPDGRANLWSAEQVSGVPGADHPPAAPARAVDGGSSLPLVLLTPKTQTRFLNSSYSALHATMEAPPAVEMHAADAAARQVGDGDVVRVWNERGSLELPVRVSGRAQEGTVVVPWGWWGEGVNVNALTNDTLTDWGGGVAFFDTRVDVSRVR